MKIVISCAVALLVSACGTVTRGTTNEVTFNSEPAGAQMQTSTGLSCPETPCTLPISRKQEFIATFTLAGYAPQQVSVTTDVSGGGAAGFAGNVLVGGLIGMAVDASTGAALDHKPNPVFARMAPLAKRTAPPAQRGRRHRAPVS
jgi:uncharacterized protein YceK